MRQYISIDDNCEDYFVVLLNSIYTDKKTLTPIHTYETVATINKRK